MQILEDMWTVTGRPGAPAAPAVEASPGAGVRDTFLELQQVRVESRWSLMFGREIERETSRSSFTFATRLHRPM